MVLVVYHCVYVYVCVTVQCLDITVVAKSSAAAVMASVTTALLVAIVALVAM